MAMSKPAVLKVTGDLVSKTLAAAVRAMAPGTSWGEARGHVLARRVMVNGVVCIDEARRLKQGDRAFSLRQVAHRIDVEPAYLSKIERDQVPPPGEETIRRLARELSLDADVLLAMAGKVSTDLKEIIVKRPTLFADLIRELKDMPDHAILRIARDVRDGDW